MMQPGGDVWIVRLYRAWLGPDQPLPGQWIARGTDYVWYSFPDKAGGWEERVVERAFGWSMILLSDPESTGILERCGGARPVNR